MRLNDYYNYSLKEIIRNKKYVFMLLLNIICLLIFIIALITTLTYKNMIDNVLKYNNLVNMVGVDIKNPKNIEEELKILKNVKYVENVIHQKYFGVTPSLKEYEEAYVWLYPLTMKNQLYNMSYKKELKNDEVIIPKEFYPHSYDESGIDLTNHKIIDGESLIGKYITLQYTVRDYSTTNLDIIEYKELKLKVVGTYDHKYGGYSMEDVFVNLEVIKLIKDNKYLNRPQHDKPSELYYLQVDNNQHLNNVRKSLKKMGYENQGSPVQVNHKNYNTFVYGVGAITIGSFIFIIIIKYLFAKKIVNDNKTNYSLKIVIGYTKEDLIKIELLKNYILDILAIVIISIICYGILIYYNKNMIAWLKLGLIPSFPTIPIIILLSILFIIEYLIYKVALSILLNANLSLTLKGDL